MMKVEIETTVVGDIIQLSEKYHSDYGEIYDKVVKKVINMGDEQIKQALIKMGWTPPPLPRTRELHVYPSYAECQYSFNHLPLTVKKIEKLMIGRSLDKDVYFKVVSIDHDVDELRGIWWDDIWIHPDVKYGLAQQILSLKRD